MNVWIDLMNFHTGWEYSSHPLFESHSPISVVQFRNQLVHHYPPVEDIEIIWLSQYIVFYNSAYNAFFLPCVSIIDHLDSNITDWKTIRLDAKTLERSDSY